MKQHVTIFLIAVLMFCSCNSDNKSFTEFDLDKTVDSRVINLSEMLMDIHSVKLQTADSILIGQYTNFLVGDQYIISIDNDKIIQFSSTGRLIRILARAGKGPQEFQRVDASAMDKRNAFLYINHRGDHKHIIVYDLNTGEFVKRILTGVENLITKIYVINDSTLLIVPRMNPKFNMYYLSNTGRIVDGIAPPKTKGIGLETSIDKVLDYVYYMPKEYDTLYRVTGTRIEPYCYFKLEDRFTFDHNSTGNFVYLSANAPAFIIACKVHARIVMNDDGETFSMNADKLTRFWINKKEKSVFEISGFKNDFYGIEEKIDPWNNYISISNDMGYISYPSVFLKSIIDSTLAVTDLNDTIRNRISELNNQLQEDDNPVLVVGRVRK